MPASQRSLFWPEIASRQAELAILAGNKLISTAAGGASVQEVFLGWQCEPPPELALADWRYLLRFRLLRPTSSAAPSPAERTILSIPSSKGNLPCSLSLSNSFPCLKMKKLREFFILRQAFARKPLFCCLKMEEWAVFFILRQKWSGLSPGGAAASSAGGSLRVARITLQPPLHELL